MRLRLARLGVVAVGVFALLGTMTPPAHATTIIDTVFVGTAHVAGGIGYPILTLDPQVPTTTCLPLHGIDAGTNCHPVYDHPRSVSVASDTCTDVTENIAKAGKDPLHVGPCSFSGSGTVTGHCGQSGGQVSGTYVDSLGLVYEFDVHFTGVAGEIIVTGHITKISPPGSSGKIVGVVTATPPTPVQTPDQSCTDKSAEDFGLVGKTTATILNIL